MGQDRLPPFERSGVLLVDKPKEWTSHDVVNFFRRKFNIAKVGHCGTLDPAATGLLVLVVGQATKLAQRLSGQDKTYEATMLLGTETDSQDMDGEIIAEKDWSAVTPEAVAQVVARFTGELEQTPPMVSAKKIDGKRLYELARQGKVVDREPVKITVHSFAIKEVRLPQVDIVLECSKGTYVRTICHDIGAELGCGGTLFSLRRTKSGVFSVEGSMTIDEARELPQEALADRFWNDYGQWAQQQ